VDIAELPAECGLVEAGVATADEWKGLIRRQAGFFSFDPDTRYYCMITVPARGATRRVRHGNWSPPCRGINGGDWRSCRRRRQPSNAPRLRSSQMYVGPSHALESTSTSCAVAARCRRECLALSAPGGEWTMATIARPPCDEAAILAGSCEQPATKNGPWILAATILGTSMAFIDGTVVNVALPALQSALHATLADVQWVVESYALFLAALLLIGGSLGDLYGRRKVFAAGVLLFSVASAWCGLAPNIRQLMLPGASKE